jgi:ABC-2 type transport system ATP-binding protein
MSAAIDIDSVTKIFRPRHHPAITVLDHLSLSVPTGQIVGILGAPGSGKTTLIRVLAGLLAPSSGIVRTNGADVARGHEGGPPASGAVLAGTWNMSWQHSPWETLLADDQSAATSDDSGCSCRPLALARQSFMSAIQSDAPTLLLDEPTLGLKESDGAQLLHWIERLTREQGKTILLATRHLEIIGRHCDRGVLLHQGRIRLDRPAAELASIASDEQYEIRVRGHLDGDWSDWFDGLRIEPIEGGETRLHGPIADQSALHGVLTKIRDSGLPLLSFQRIEPELCDVLGPLLRLGCQPIVSARTG